MRVFSLSRYLTDVPDTPFRPQPQWSQDRQSRDCLNSKNISVTVLKSTHQTPSRACEEGLKNLLMTKFKIPLARLATSPTAVEIMAKMEFSAARKVLRMAVNKSVIEVKRPEMESVTVGMLAVWRFRD